MPDRDARERRRGAVPRDVAAEEALAEEALARGLAALLLDAVHVILQQNLQNCC